MRKRLLTPLLTLLALAPGSFRGARASADADSLSETAIFIRCYTQITGVRPPIAHAGRRAVAAGTQSAIEACLALLNKAQLGSDGNLTNANDPEAVQVLNHLNDFHRSWFLSDNLDAAVPDRDSDLIRDREMHDETESALHVTRALFGDQIPYSEIVTSSTGMESIRTSGRTTEPTWDGKRGFMTDGTTNQFQKFRGLARGVSLNPQCFPSGSCFEDYMNLGPSEFVMNAELTQTGDLLGVRPMGSEKVRLETHSGLGSNISASPNTSAVYYNDVIKVHESLGAGFLGTKSYLLLNLGRPFSTFSDGGLDLARRWSKAVLSEALCRDTPPIRAADAAPFVTQSSTLPFRRGTSCMGCHASLDPLAAIARAVSIRPTPNFEGQSGRGLASSQLAVHSAIVPSETAWPDLDAQFFKRPPKGALFFRSFSGEKVSVEIPGDGGAKGAFTALGTALAATDDLYVCAASRYYQLFTGIRVSLQDPGDTSKTALTASDTAYRNEVITLGKALKKHQSLRKLVTDILALDRYRRPSPRENN